MQHDASSAWLLSRTLEGENFAVTARARRFVYLTDKSNGTDLPGYFPWDSFAIQ